MSDPADNTVIPNVAKQKRRFAPNVKPRGQGRSSADSNEALQDPASESSAAPAPTPSTSSGNKPIGHIRPDSSEGRLPSVHDSQRTRGGAIKMKFKPTVPTRRNKKESSSSVIDDALKTQESQRSDDRFGSQRGRGRGDGAGRGRGRGRGRGVVIANATGVFSLGPSAMASRARQNFGGSGSSAMHVGDTARTEVAGDESTDMSTIFNNEGDGNTPVVLEHVPRLAGDLDLPEVTNTPRKVPWFIKRPEVAEIDPSLSDDDPDQSTKDSVRVKEEAVSDEENSIAMAVDDEKSPAVQEKQRVRTGDNEQANESLPGPSWLMNEDAAAQNIFALDDAHRLISVADDELLFFQLPSVLPKFDSQIKIKKKDEDESMTTALPENEADNSTDKPPQTDTDTLLEDTMAALDIEDIPEGQVGKLIVYKSGKIKMKIGQIVLDVNQGTRSSFLENVMVVDTDSEDSKKAIELGHVVQKFVCMPDMDELLKEEHS